MQYKIIVATCKNNGIGYCDTLPWNIKEDLRHFSKLTKGNGKNAIVMGKNTWESIGSKPLPNRDNFVLSTTMKYEPPVLHLHSGSRTFICKNIDEVEMKCRENNYENVWIIGGETVYKQFLERNCISECLITYIDHEFECDTFFPILSSTMWKLEYMEYMENTSKYTITIKRYKYIM